MKHDLDSKVNTEIKALVNGRHGDPFRLLGIHQSGKFWRLIVYAPGTKEIVINEQYLIPDSEPGFFVALLEKPPVCPYQILLDGKAYIDPYQFEPYIQPDELYLFNEGKLTEGWHMLGANPKEYSGIKGTQFAVWAPNAAGVSIMGDFNGWHETRHPMRTIGSSGVWSLFLPNIQNGLYKYAIIDRNGHRHIKSDPYARAFEHRPGTAGQIIPAPAFNFSDSAWMDARTKRDWLHEPMNVYEVHAGSWQRKNDRYLGWKELENNLIPYLCDMGYTHLELMPITEHPLDESWGYQSTGYFAPTSRFGTPDELRHFINACHHAGIGVLLDWVPAHFPADDFALSHFDGTALYEHDDPRLGFHPDWGTLIFNYGRNEVRSFLLSSAKYWLKEFHFDGLRVDAVASMLYLDYSRKENQWLPNRHGGRENLEAIDFIREFNSMVHADFPGTFTIAEESTAWPGVSRPVYTGGLGFSMKWNMGWMNDTLSYMHEDPIFRRYHHEKLTFSQLYAYTENFVLPLSHDEVVHGKGSLLSKMPGDEWQQFANLRLLFVFMMTFPGKKLSFMGNEFAQKDEWRATGSLDWNTLKLSPHHGIKLMVRDLNHLYSREPALYFHDFEQKGFSWINCHDTDQSILSWLRYDDSGNSLLIIMNFTPVVRYNYELGVPSSGPWQTIFNSDSVYYGGSNAGPEEITHALDKNSMGFTACITLTLPPLAGMVLKLQKA